jgi:flagellar L-ring protein precursor FlgH
MKRILAIAGLLTVAGCQTSSSDITKDPALTPVGYGLMTPRDPLPTASASPGPHSAGSTAGGFGYSMFRDARAARVGDVITVTIEMDDKAEFDNETGRSRDSEVDFGLGAGFSLFGLGVDNTVGRVGGDLSAQGGSAATGRGTIDRSEKLRLQIAAVVTEVLPNGNLVINGSQEIRVNYEIRVLAVAGVVRPLDISRSNTVSYDKIAEARISYAGRGRISDVQQPGYAHRVFDANAPY